MTVGTFARVDEDRAIGSLLGLAVGDALGTTLEFSTRDAGSALTDMVGGGPFRLRPGEWTDDTSMALCLAQSLIADGGQLDPTDLMERFTRWYRGGENSCTGRCFDIGNTVRSALEHFERTRETAASLPPDPQGAGNGTLMRLAPAAIVAAPNLDRAAELAEAQSRTTHRAPLAHDCCRLFARMLVEAIAGASRDEVLRPRQAEGDVAAVAAGSWRGKRRDEIGSSGYVLDTLEASLWCVGTTNSFADAVLLAANLGDDADTVAAVTGQLAGALYGANTIPERWLATLAWRERIERLARELLAVGRDELRVHARREGPALSSPAGKFAWNDDNVVMKDEYGRVITPREAMVRQLEDLRTGDHISQTSRAPSSSIDADRLDAETLLNLGFIDAARWISAAPVIAYELDGPHSAVNKLRLDQPNALYAFVRGEQVLYIGKTARTLRRRFTGYCRPGKQARTNWRCNGKIRAALAAGHTIRIFAFNPISQLRYGEYEINLAAGLEDALIAAFDPPWNGRDKGQPISEEAEREETEEAHDAPAPLDETSETSPALPVIPVARFSITLGQAYYEQGLINPGIDASQHLGQHGEPIRISFSDESEPVTSAINRNAAANGAVRVVGRNREIARWFKQHFRRGEIVEAEVLDAHHIRLNAAST